MTIEAAAVRSVAKPWGRADLRPFGPDHGGAPVGERWFTRASGAPPAALLPKLLFTAEPLSIQVHPTDSYAAAAGQPNGKAECWYILAAGPGGRVALGLKRHLDKAELRDRIVDGSIAGLVAWRTVKAHDFISVPAGTIHAIGEGLVLAEIQRQSDTTFRLFDFGRGRDLHVDEAVAAADAGPAPPQPQAVAFTPARTVLVASADFVVERVTLGPASAWSLDVVGEAWLLVLAGRARVGAVAAALGEAVFIEDEEAGLTAGDDGLVALLAYRAAGPRASLLCERRPHVVDA